MYSNVFSSEIRQQNRTEQNRTEQNRTEQNRTLTGLPSVAEQNRIITKLISIQNKILQSLFQSFNRTIISYTKQNIIFNYFKIFYAIF